MLLLSHTGAMPRAIWSGAISFGLVTIPVKLYTAVSQKAVRFNQLDTRTGARVKRKWVSAADGSDVNNDDIVRGYELTAGNFVTIDDDEMASFDPETSRTIDIVEFVELADIDPVYYDNAYFLVPDELAAKSYALLSRAMERSGRVGIARLVMRTKEYLAALRPRDGLLVLSTMNYDDEVNSPSEIGGFEVLDGLEPTDAELEMADQLIETLTGDFDPSKYQDTYRLKVLGMIEAKAAGENITIAVDDEPRADKVVDLMAALEASVTAAKQTRKRHPSAGDGEAKAKSPAKRKKPKAAKSA
jgi:DNA end-binding protein Ku